MRELPVILLARENPVKPIAIDLTYGILICPMSNLASFNLYRLKGATRAGLPTPDDMEAASSTSVSAVLRGLTDLTEDRRPARKQWRSNGAMTDNSRLPSSYFMRTDSGDHWKSLCSKCSGTLRCTIGV